MIRQMLARKRIGQTTRRRNRNQSWKRFSSVSGFCVFIAVFILGAGGASLYGQRLQDFVTRTPLEPGEYLILGFMGGRDRWDDDRRGVRRLALKLRSMHLPGVHVETVENTKRGTALELIRSAFDRDQDGVLDEQERASVRLILYGQSFGGAAVVKLARQLQEMDVPVLLTVQIDSVGWGDAVIPSNVASAANLYQRDGLFIRGEPQIRAENPGKTKILGNFRFSYRGRNIDLSKVPWHKKIFRAAHAKMELDPEVWAKAAEIILNAMGQQAFITGTSAISARPSVEAPTQWLLGTTQGSRQYRGRVGGRLLAHLAAHSQPQELEP